MGQVQIRDTGSRGGRSAAAVARRESGEEHGFFRSGGGGRDLETEMEEILSKIAGVGQVQVMLTEDADGEKQLAQDTELSYSGSTKAPEDYSRSSEVVLADSGGEDTVVVTRQQYPTYRGALVVCQGETRRMCVWR